jgi:hypothetical protein
VCVEVSTEARMGTLAPFSHLVRSGKVFLRASNLTKVLKLFFIERKKSFKWFLCSLPTKIFNQSGSDIHIKPP